MFREVEDFVIHSKVRGLSHKTIKSYRNTALLFLKETQQEFRIEDVGEISKSMVEAFILKKKDAGCSEKYINTIIRTLRAFFVFLLEDDYITKNPMAKVRFIRENNKVLEVYSDEQVAQLINAYSDADFLAIRNKTLIMLQIDTGIRCSETIDIMETDVLDDRILINGKGKKQRYVAISSSLFRQLKCYKKAKDSYFYRKPKYKNFFLSRTGRPLTVEAIERVYKEAQKRVDIVGIRVSPHTSRHYFATKMLDSNPIYTVSKLLGHSSIRITEHYLKSVTSAKLIDDTSIQSPLTVMKLSR